MCGEKEKVEGRIVPESNLPFLYLDIDGVLIGRKNPSDLSVSIAPHAEEFLDFALRNFRCFWLSTHGKGRDSQNILRVFRRYTRDVSFLNKIAAIPPVAWRTLKIDAIDLNSDFYWIDDSPLQVEIQRLEMLNLRHRLILINTHLYPDDLLRAQKLLKEKI